MRRSLGKRVRAGERGQALVEFALVLPVMLLLVTGMMTFGIALHNYLELTDAVAIGAQALALDRGVCVGTACSTSGATDPCAATATIIENAAPFLYPKDVVPANATFTFVFNGTTVYGPGNAPSCSSSSTSTGAAGDLGQGDPAQITATFPCNLSVFGHNYAPSCTMTAQTTEIVQ